jgi:hypothetical protein
MRAQIVALCAENHLGEEGLNQIGLLCDWLEVQYGYIFTSWNAAWNHVVATYLGFQPPLKAHARRITTKGPCQGIGYHCNVRSGRHYVISVVQCPCSDQNGQPGERLRVI